VVVAVARDARFERDDIHLYAPLDITFAQAAMGDQIEAESLDGTVKISIPRGSQPQAEVRIKGRGLPRLRGGARGDLIYVLRVRVPKDLSQERAELLRKFAELGNERIPEGDGQGGGFLGGLFGKKKK
jgi:molecular chaperone DnaJ